MPPFETADVVGDTEPPLEGPDDSAGPIDVEKSPD
jgi:hypothetical protein